jgi:cold shock CspA family protein
MKTGVVKYFSMDSKYGFIINDEEKRMYLFILMSLRELVSMN